MAGANPMTKILVETGSEVDILFGSVGYDKKSLRPSYNPLTGNSIKTLNNTST
jgi:hypothetical protein